MGNGLFPHRRMPLVRNPANPIQDTVLKMSIFLDIQTHHYSRARPSYLQTVRQYFRPAESRVAQDPRSSLRNDLGIED